MAEIDNKENIKQKSNRRGNPNWYKGMSSPNPKGNTHSKDIAGLIEALEDKSKRAGYKNFDDLVADRAITYKEVLIAVMKKVYPDNVGGDNSGNALRIQIFEGLDAETIRSFIARGREVISKAGSV